MDFETELKIRQRLKDDYEHYASRCLFIRSKKAGDFKPLTFNRIQRYIDLKCKEQLLAHNHVRVIIVKSRQQGVSTWIQGRFYWRVTHRKGVRAFILTHESEATKNLFEMANRFHDNCPPPLKLKSETNNSNELLFSGIDSGYRIGTAGNKAVGRSATIQYLHGSEVAFWENASEHAKGILQTVPQGNGTEIFLESTANGLGNYFHEQWQMAESGKSDFMPIFLPWYWQEEYTRPITDGFELTPEEKELKEIYELTDDQLNWRRSKITEFSVGGMNGERSFMQEYPCNSTEAFQANVDEIFINATLVMKARKCNVEGIGPLVVGIDPARFGDDRTVIIRRKGRKAYGMEVYKKLDTMEIVGKIYRIIVDESPEKVFIDIGGLGAGIYDRLKEMGYGDVIVGVNSANSALDSDKYTNKRAEMWANLKEFLLDYPCQIPDSNELHADLCSPFYKHDSKDRLLIEKKSDMKKRGIRSSDCADALGLTLSYPTKLFANKESDRELARQITSFDQRVNKLRKGAYK